MVATITPIETKKKTAAASKIIVLPIGDIITRPLKLAKGTTHSATLDQAKATARAKGAKRLKDVFRFLDELYRLCDKMGYDFGLLAAHSANETNWWRSDGWNLKLSCAGIGADDDRPFDKWPSWKTPEQSARAMVVHYSAYIGGYVAALRPYIELDPKWQAVFEAGYVFKGQTLGDLRGKWMSDPFGPEAIGEKLNTIQRQTQTPTPTEPKPGNAPLPEDIIMMETGNWHDRHPSAYPGLFVNHCTGDLELWNTLNWFMDANSQASSHAVIDRDGKIYQFVSSLKASWTNGDVDNPRTDIPYLNHLLEVSAPWPNPHTINDFSLTIEFVATPEVPPTEAQYNRGTALQAYWRDRYEIFISRATMVRHGDINSVNRSYCPGPDFDLARQIRALGGDPNSYAIAA